MIGASAGGIPAMRELFADLPADYAAAVFVVMHVAPEAPSILPDILDRASPLPVIAAQSGARVRPGTITVAPPDLHLVLDGDTVRLSRAPRENRHRPSVDVLFRTAAVAFGRRVTGVVLSGMLDDGAAGLWAIKRRGGAAVVQDPDDAEYPGMPQSALDVVRPDYQVPVRAMAPILVELARQPITSRSEPVPDTMASEVRMALENESSMEQLDAMGRRVPLTCPECGGSLWEVDNGGPRYRCHVGHAYSMRTLAAEQALHVEAALWAGLRKLEESERVARRMASYARENGDARSADYHAESAQNNAAHAQTLRTLLAEHVDASGGRASEK